MNTVHERLKAVSVLFGLKKITNGRKRIVSSGTLMERSRTMNGCNAERLRTFEPASSNALERKLENFHGTVTLTVQKRKNHFKKI
jgi:hypothetical protein